MSEPGPNGRGTPRLYVVAICHLDTQWRWTVRDVIRRFLPRTLRENFALFEVFPDYILSFEGAFRYQLAEEYYPEEFERLRSWVAKGRWRIAGSMVDAPDINLSSAESLIRHILYASRYFRRTFGRTSADIFLPDCFGFPFSLPTIASHCGLLGFSSQKFGKWMAPSSVPFDIGLWEGPDGSRLAAALEPGGYGESLTEDLSRSKHWRRVLRERSEERAVPVALKYFGVGDRGGSPDEASLFWLARSISASEPIKVVHSGSDQLFRDLTSEEREQLPVHRGELLLPTHGTGCWTSQSILKRWNRQNEILADSAERAAVFASWLARFPYPAEQLQEDWIRFLWHQMHDDLTGTSIPEAYEISWNDEVVSLNRFATVLTDSVAAIARGLDTETEGEPLVVFNPLSVDRSEALAIQVDFGDDAPDAIRVFDPEGQETPSQIVAREAGVLEIVFVARLPALGLSVYDLQPASEPCSLATDLDVGEDFIENEHYRVELDQLGDLGRIFDKNLGCEILAATAGLELLPDLSHKWPAWEIRYDDLSTPGEPLSGSLEKEIVESGPARAAVRIRRRVSGSTLSQTIRLAAAEAGRCVEVDCQVDWRTRGRLLKARFPLRSAAETATYDLGCGVIERGNNTESKHEVPAHQWADLTDPGKQWGVSILSDCKYGWDKPDDQTLRLSLLRSPRTRRRFPHQATQDFGHHRFSYALYSHPGSWHEADTASLAAGFNQPLAAFHAKRHDGPLGRHLALMTLDTENVAIRALKRSEEGTELILRLQEMTSRDSRVTLSLGDGIGSAREVDGCERDRGKSQVEDGSLHTRLRPFQPKTVALRMTPPQTRIPPLRTASALIDFDTEALSFHSRGAGCDFDGEGHSIPGELFPTEMMSGEIPFRLGPASPGEPHCLTCTGQTLQLPIPGFDTVFLLAASIGEDCAAVFRIGHETHSRTIHSWSRPIGQWRQQRYVLGRAWGEPAPGYLIRTPVAWIGTHRHDRRLRDQAYRFCYLFRYSITLPEGESLITLPNDPRVRIFAATVAQLGATELVAAHQLFG